MLAFDKNDARSFGDYKISQLPGHHEAIKLIFLSLFRIAPKREKPSSVLAYVWRLLSTFVLNEYFIPAGILKMFGD